MYCLYRFYYYSLHSYLYVYLLSSEIINPHFLQHKIYYNNISDDDYNSITTTDWNLKIETLKYLEKDLETLMEVVDKFGKYIYNTYGLQITDCLTIAKLAINILYSNYLSVTPVEKPTENTEVLPLIKNVSIFNFIKEGYYGGISEVYIPFGKDLSYIDVNSLYSYASLNPMPGTQCEYLESLDIEKGLELDNLFGFFYAKITTSNLYLGLLPLHINGLLILPNGEYEGIWSSEELKFVRDNGYKVLVLKGYNFNKIYIGIFI